MDIALPTTAIKTTQDKRLAAAREWLHQQFPHNRPKMTALQNDASFRRYFRVSIGPDHWIMMDCPPQHEDLQRFIGLARALHRKKQQVPQIFTHSDELGFLLQTDFGDITLSRALRSENASYYYTVALNTLLELQQVKGVQVPRYTRELLEQECELYPDWYCTHELNHPLTASERKSFQQCCRLLIASAMEQPQVFVHRDYHSRNLMVLNNDHLGILDFQDAVIGPITYDVVSLLRDCYIAWPGTRARHWLDMYEERAVEIGLIHAKDRPKLQRWFDWMGVQRHLKAVGIFARLKHRDNKPTYLQDIPRVLSYLRKVCQHYPELHDLLPLISRKRRSCKR